MRSSLVLLSLAGIGIALLAGTVMQAQSQAQPATSAAVARKRQPDLEYYRMARMLAK